MICLNCTTYICSCNGNNAVTQAYKSLIKEVKVKIETHPLGVGFMQKDVKMRNKKYTGKPSVNHAPCSVVGCRNYYNINEKELQIKCLPCRRQEKKRGKK